jgi:CheY-like chemotaxis protein
MGDKITNAVLLIVDDDKASRRLLQAQLHLAGFRNLIVTSSGQEALDIVDKDTPDLVLLDVMMPGMTGYEVTTTCASGFPTNILN